MVPRIMVRTRSSMKPCGQSLLSTKQPRLSSVPYPKDPKNSTCPAVARTLVWGEGRPPKLPNSIPFAFSDFKMSLIHRHARIQHERKTLNIQLRSASLSFAPPRRLWQTWRAPLTQAKTLAGLAKCLSPVDRILHLQRLCDSTPEEKPRSIR